jgi:hypothetical protein
MATIFIRRGASKVRRVYRKTRLLSIRIQGQARGELQELGAIEIKSSADLVDDRIELSLYLRPEVAVNLFETDQGLIFTKHAKE